MAAEKENRFGSILSIKFRNFLTYDRATFDMGQNLNIFLGANGSGKSTIIAGIILGLGGSPKTAGRGDKFSNYIKAGKDKSCVVIVLYNPLGNDVVKTAFNAANTVKRHLNGSEVSLSDLLQSLKKYNIQTDNLCQILPQEKVENFAKMNDRERLTNTLQTIGDSKLFEDLDVILNSKNTKEASKNELNELESNIKFVENEALVIFEKMEKILEGKYTYALTCMLNRKVVDIFMRMVDEDIEKFKGNYMDNMSCVTTVYNNLDKYWEVFRCHLVESHEKYRKLQKDWSKRDRIIAKAKEDVIISTSNAANSIAVLVEIRLDFEVQMANYYHYAIMLKAELDQMKPKGNLNELKNELANLKERLNESVRQNSNLFKEYDEVQIQFNAKMNEQRSLQFECNKLQELSNQKMAILRLDRHAFAAYNWIQENTNRFRGPVFGPLFFEMEVDPKNAKFVTTLVSKRELMSFMCIEMEDCNILLKELIEDRKMNISLVQIDLNEAISRDIDMATLKRKFGFMNLLIDFVKCSRPEVEHYLKAEFDLHVIPVGEKNLQSVVEEVARSGLQRFISNDSVFSIRRHGGKPIIDIEMLWGDDGDMFRATGDTERLQQTRHQVEHISVTLNELRERMNALDERKRTAQSEKCELEQIVAKHNVVLDKAARDVATYERKKLDMGVQFELMMECQKRTVELKQEEKEMKKVCANVSVGNMKAWIDYYRLGTHVDKGAIELKAFAVNLNECAETVLEKFEAMKENNDTVEKQPSDLEGKQNMWNRAYAIKQLMYDLDPQVDLYHEFLTFPLLPDDITLLRFLNVHFLVSLKENWGDTNAGNLQVDEDEILRVKRRELELKNNYKKVTNILKNFSVYIQGVKDSWRARVTHLVGQIDAHFSKMFRDMGCNGSVEFHFPALKAENDPEDCHLYKECGIQILVKFREDQELEALNALVQSGGERAVSVAIYLLSLQALDSRTPFRCIDEINQGMDKYNERRIWDLLSKASEKGNTQYFLLTPKLLPGLCYTNKMKIHVLFNGEGFLDYDETKRLRDIKQDAEISKNQVAKVLNKEMEGLSLGDKMERWSEKKFDWLNEMDIPHFLTNITADDIIINVREFEMGD